MVTIVIILIASIWILFQTLAGTETSQREKKQKNKPTCDILLWVMFLQWLSVWQLLQSVVVRDPSGSDQSQGNTYCLRYLPEAQLCAKDVNELSTLYYCGVYIIRLNHVWFLKLFFWASLNCSALNKLPFLPMNWYIVNILHELY